MTHFQSIDDHVDRPATRRVDGVQLLVPRRRVVAPIWNITFAFEEPEHIGPGR